MVEWRGRDTGADSLAAKVASPVLSMVATLSSNHIRVYVLYMTKMCNFTNIN